MPAKVAKAPKRPLTSGNDGLLALEGASPPAALPALDAKPPAPDAAGGGDVEEFFRLPDESAVSAKKIKQWMRLDAAVILAWHDGALLAGLISEAGPSVGKDTPGYVSMQAQGGFRWIIPVKADHWLARALTGKFASTWSNQRVYHAKGLVVGCKGASEVEPATMPLIMDELKALAAHEDYKPNVAMIRVDLTDEEAEALVSGAYDKADPATKLHKCPLPRF